MFKQVYFSVILLAALLATQSSFAETKEEKRAKQVEQLTTTRFDQHNMEWKMIESRMVILYLLDVLPPQGNPYYHMADFGATATLKAFKAGHEDIKAVDAALDRGSWLPKNDGAGITAQDLQTDKDLTEVVMYWAQYVAIADVLEKVVYPAIKANGSLILPLKDSVSQEVANDFAKVFGNPNTGQQGHIQYIRDKYLALFKANPELAQRLEPVRKKVVLTIAGIVASAMTTHLEHLKDQVPSLDPLQNFLDKIKQLSERPVSTPSEIDSVKDEAIKAFSTVGVPGSVTEKAFNGVDLPSTGSIDGYAAAFEVVMRLEVGNDVLKQIKSEIETW